MNSCIKSVYLFKAFDVASWFGIKTPLKDWYSSRKEWYSRTMKYICTGQKNSKNLFRKSIGVIKDRVVTSTTALWILSACQMFYWVSNWWWHGKMHHHKRNACQGRVRKNNKYDLRIRVKKLKWHAWTKTMSAKSKKNSPTSKCWHQRSS